MHIVKTQCRSGAACPRASALGQFLISTPKAFTSPLTPTSEETIVPSFVCTFSRSRFEPGLHEVSLGNIASAARAQRVLFDRSGSSQKSLRISAEFGSPDHLLFEST